MDDPYKKMIIYLFIFQLFLIGQTGTFMLYGGICIVGTLLTALFVPETRGKSIEEIQRFFTKTSTRYCFKKYQLNNRAILWLRNPTSFKNFLFQSG